ncbi:hypothetical protein Ac42p216 [Acinetobacter phage Ac42]|uniref:hypothetical protein n=1 Tax=Acinetobacter phage Ac42 TaxID=762660 RepID=UPI0001EBCE00|nr:hypothetical protein Ac42p216 [Acinetobacter phage Ac42]ADI96452.1 hypothetical protein Ac42p216 [Acinetobacter phage Ac42]
MKFSKYTIHLASTIILAFGLIGTTVTAYTNDKNHARAINGLIKEVSHKQPVVEAQTVEALEAQVDRLQLRVDQLESKQYNNQSKAQSPKETPKVRTNVHPEYEMSKAGQVVRNSDTLEEALANCNMEENFVHFAMYGEPHPSCR